MSALNGSGKHFRNVVYRWVSPIVDPVKILQGPARYIGYLKDWMSYSKMEGAEPIAVMDTQPCLYDKTTLTRVDAHYFYQDLWAFKKIFASGVTEHVDVGSRIDFIGFLTAITKVTFIDIRPLETKLDNCESQKGSIVSLPYKHDAVGSLSCLHVAEHIGLGRYGDSLDPRGTQQAAKELSRILARNGNLYFSVPVGKPRLCFNAHRIHSPQQILDYFSDLQLVELSGIDDEGRFMEHADQAILASCEYGCGLFWFTKP